jgi:hypothetical protein
MDPIAGIAFKDSSLAMLLSGAEPRLIHCSMEQQDLYPEEASVARACHPPLQVFED